MTRFPGRHVLALSATGTAVAISVLAAWQRGGSPAEKLVWVAVGVVLVGGAHLLPALCRSAPMALRWVGGVLWAACMLAASYGHVTFFLLAQQHAGELRVQGLNASHVAPDSRSLAVVMAQRATVTAELATANAERCTRDCAALRVRRLSLTAKLDALNAETDEIKRQQVTEDRIAVRQAILRDDPVTQRLAGLLGWSVMRVDLFAGLLLAAVLEATACLLWCLALRQGDRSESRPESCQFPGTVAASHGAVTEAVKPETPLTPVSRVAPRDEVTRLRQAIAARELRPTVAEIRRHLGCSQAKALALRRRLDLPSA